MDVGTLLLLAVSYPEDVLAHNSKGSPDAICPPLAVVSDPDRLVGRLFDAESGVCQSQIHLWV